MSYCNRASQLLAKKIKKYIFTGLYGKQKETHATTNNFQFIQTTSSTNDRVETAVSRLKEVLISFFKSQT